MTFKIKDLSDLIMPIGVLLLGYTVMNRLIPPPSGVSCPKGQRYTQGLLGGIFGCDSGYREQVNLLSRECICIAGETPPPVEPPVEPPTCNWWDYINPLSPCFLTPPVEPPVEPPVCIPNWQCIPAMDGSETDGCGHAGWNSACLASDPTVYPTCPDGATYIGPPVPHCKPRYVCPTRPTETQWAYGYDATFHTYSCMEAPTGIVKTMYDSCLADGDMPYKAGNTWGCLRL